MILKFDREIDRNITLNEITLKTSETDAEIRLLVHFSLLPFDVEQSMKENTLNLFIGRRMNGWLSIGWLFFQQKNISNHIATRTSENGEHRRYVNMRHDSENSTHHV